MTPRESLEAAGWVEVWQPKERRWFSPDQSDMKEYSKTEALAQLARDEAKETSDGRVEVVACNTLAGDSGSSSADAAPVATSVSAPKLVNRHTDGKTPVASERQQRNESLNSPDERVEFEKWVVKESGWGQAATKRQDGGEYFYQEIGDFWEVWQTRSRCASSSSAAPASLSAIELAQKFHEAYERLAPQFGYETRKESAKPWAEVPENNRKLMTTVCREVMRGAADLLDKASAEIHMLERAAESHKYTVSDLRDSRDRLQGALRAAANHLHYVGQEQAAGQARAALGDPK